MRPVTVGRYKGPGYTGWVCTENWILYQHEDGSIWVCNGREPGSGRVQNAGVVIHHDADGSEYGPFDPEAGPATGDL